MDIIIDFIINDLSGFMQLVNSLNPYVLLIAFFLGFPVIIWRIK